MTGKTGTGYATSTIQNSMLDTLLDKRYQICDRLSHGGFGETYRATDTKRPGSPICVVKCLKPLLENGLNDFETARRLFDQEAKILEQLGSHNQIPRLLARFEIDGEFYLVQEFIEGHLLSEELNPEHRWREQQAVQFLQDVLGILEFIHGQGVIHRDIKPENLIRRQLDQRFVLIDFGAVKSMQPAEIRPSQSHQTIAISSEGYTAIEQLRGKPCMASDLYALGMITIQGLTGLHPKEFEENLHLQEMAWTHHTEISSGLIAILSTMTRYHWKDRYQSASEVLKDLQKWSSNLDLTDTGVPAPTPVHSSSYTPTLIKTPSSTNTTPSVEQQTPFQLSIPAISRPSDKPMDLLSQVATNVEEQRVKPGLRVKQALRAIKPVFAPRVLTFLLGISLISVGGVVFLWFIAGLGSSLPRSQPTISVPSPANFLINTWTRESPLYALAFHPDGMTLVSGGANHIVESWDLNTQHPIQSFSNHFNAITSLAVSHDGMLLATGGRDANANLWDIQTGQLLHSLQGHQWDVLSVAFSPDNQTVVTASEDNTLRIWDTKAGQLLHTFSGFTNAFSSVVITPRNLLIAGSADNTIRVWDLNTRELRHSLKGHTGEVYAVATSLNGAVVISGSADNTIKIWNSFTGKLLRTLNGHVGAVRSVALSPDGKTVVSGSSDHTIRLWNFRTGELLHTLRDHSSEVYAIAISPDGKTIASSSLDSTIKLWQMP